MFHPPHVACFIIDGRLTSNWPAQQDYFILLPYLPVAVCDNMTGVGIDPKEPCYLHGNTCFFACFPHRAFGGRLANLHLPHRERPLPGVAPPLQQQAAPLIYRKHTTRGTRFRWRVAAGVATRPPVAGRRLVRPGFRSWNRTPYD